MVYVKSYVVLHWSGETGQPNIILHSLFGIFQYSFLSVHHHNFLSNKFPKYLELSSRCALIQADRSLQIKNILMTLYSWQNLQ